jgi:hypothetical protein
VEADDAAAHLTRARDWLGIAQQAYEEYHYEQAGVAAAIATAYAQIATALDS